MSKKKIIITAIVAVIIIGGVGFLALNSRKEIETTFNETFINGNTAGNIFNNGRFCEYNGTIYFANPNDSYHLYSMAADGTGLTLLSDDIVSSINVDDHYIYYIRNNLSASKESDSKFSFLNINTDSLVRCDKDGSHLLVLDSDPCLYASLSGNYIYYIHYDSDTASTLYRVKIDGSEKGSLASSPYIPACVKDQYLYYNGLESDHNIYKFDTISLSADCIVTGNYWQPQLLGDDIIAMDNRNNYSLIKLMPMYGDALTLTEDRIDCFNAYGDYVYFQRNDEKTPALCRIRTDGSGYEEIIAGNYTEINVTSTYVYFRDFYDNTTVYRTPTYGPVNVTTFMPGVLEK